MNQVYLFPLRKKNPKDTIKFQIKPGEAVKQRANADRSYLRIRRTQLSIKKCDNPEKSNNYSARDYEGDAQTEIMLNLSTDEQKENQTGSY